MTAIYAPWTEGVLYGGAYISRLMTSDMPAYFSSSAVKTDGKIILNCDLGREISQIKRHTIMPN